jgi:hypothetical protein
MSPSAINDATGTATEKSTIPAGSRITMNVSSDHVRLAPRDERRRSTPNRVVPASTNPTEENTDHG